MDLGAAHISGLLDLGGLAASAVGAVGATIGGELNLDGATLINEDGDALNLDGAEIEGGAFLSPVTATGEVRAVGAMIGGELNLRGATLSNVGRDALVLSDAEIKGNAFFGAVNVTGGVFAPGLSIGGVLDFGHSATLSNEYGYALNLESAQLGDLILTPAAVLGTINLDAVKITVLVTPQDLASSAAS